MREITEKQQTRIDPSAAWTVVTDAPLKGLALAREAGVVLAWDERDHLALFDLRGQRFAASHAPDRVIAGAISDEGSVIALLGERSRLWILGPDLELIEERQGPPDSATVAIDPHGFYIAVASRLCLTQFYHRQGRPAGRFETRQALAHLAFVPDRPFLLGAASYGMLAGIELRPVDSSGKLDAEVVWQEALMSNVGRLTTTGDGGMVLASCFTHGVQRYDLQGDNDGAYHLGGTAALAVPDFAGRMFAVATLEGEFAILGAAGNVRWRTNLARPAIALETDPLGRYVIYGHATGEIVRLDLYGGPERPSRGAGSRAAATRPATNAVRRPDWSTPVAATDDQAVTAVVEVLDEPPRVALMTNTTRLRVFTAEGRDLGLAPEVAGVGRILRSAPGWIAAATDRQVMLYDARRNAAQRLDLSLTEITHLAIRPNTFGVAIVQERDRVGRASLAGRWVWQRDAGAPVEDLAIGADGFAAMTTNDGRLVIFDAAGTPTPVSLGQRTDQACLIEAPEGSPSRVAWITLSRRAQVLRGHDRKGKTVWESPIPWEGWLLQRLGAIALVSAPDGRSLAFDGAGHLRSQGRGSDGSNDLFGAGAPGEALRVSRQGVHLICSDLSGAVKWRTVADETLGPLAVGPPGVAVLIGRSLAWFGAQSG